MADVAFTGAAMRRRQRRQRSRWRHEQLSIAAALATVSHHSFHVGTKNDAQGARRLSLSLVGCGRRLCLRLRDRRERQSRSVTWLSGLLSWWCPHCTATKALTAPLFLLAQNLKLQKEEDEKEMMRKLEEEALREAHVRVLDRRTQDGVPLSSAEREAWRHWKWRSLGLPPQDDRRSKRKTRRRRKKWRKKKLPKLSFPRACRTWKPDTILYGPFVSGGRSCVCVLLAVRQQIHVHASVLVAFGLFLGFST